MDIEIIKIFLPTLLTVTDAITFHSISDFPSNPKKVVQNWFPPFHEKLCREQVKSYLLLTPLTQDKLQLREMQTNDTWLSGYRRPRNNADRAYASPHVRQFDFVESNKPMSDKTRRDYSSDRGKCPVISETPVLSTSSLAGTRSRPQFSATRAVIFKLYFRKRSSIE